MPVTIKPTFDGEIKNFQIIKKDGTVKKELQFKNVFLLKNVLINKTTSNNVPFNFSIGVGCLHFGTGTSTPTINDMGLESPDSLGRYISYAERSQYLFNDETTRQKFFSIKMDFATNEPGTLAGTWTEMGLGFDDGFVITRALIKDELGNPSSITILNDEYIKVSYELKIYFNIPEISGTLTTGGQTYNYKILPWPYPGYASGMISGDDYMFSLGKFNTLQYQDYKQGLNIADIESIVINNSLSPQKTKDLTGINWTCIQEPVGTYNFKTKFEIRPETTDATFTNLIIGGGYSEENNGVFVLVFDREVTKPAGEMISFDFTIDWGIA